MAPHSNDPSRRRSLVRFLRTGRDRPTFLCNRGLDRRICDLAPWVRAEAEGGHGCNRRRDGRRRSVDQGRRDRPGGSRLDFKAIRALLTEWRCHGLAYRRVEGCDGREPSPTRPDAIATVSAHYRPAAGALWHVV